MECLHCKEPKDQLAHRGLCTSCYRCCRIRKLYPAVTITKPLDPNRKPCRHCKLRNGISHKMGLCVRCYSFKANRVKYRTPRNYKGKNGGGPRGAENNETMEQLERLIESRYPTMPKEPKIERKWDFVPATVARGRGIQATQRRQLTN